MPNGKAPSNGGKNRLWSLLRRRWRVVVASGGALIILIIIAAWLAIGPILGHELASLISQRLNARLVIGSTSYHFPYGLSLRDCHLVFSDPKGQQVELMSVGDLSVTLAELPIHGGPLQIKELSISSPVVRLIRTSTGYEGQEGLLKPDNTPSQPNHQKLSDILRLRKLSLDGGQIFYEDQTAKHPFVWKDITLHLGTTPHSAAEYDFNIDANSGTLSSLNAKGNFNVDELSATLDPLSFSILLSDGKAPQQLPPEIQAILERYQVKGNLLIEGSAGGSLSAMQSSHADVTFKLHDGSAYSPEVDAALDDLQLEISAGASAHGASAIINTLSATSGGTQFSFNRGASVKVDFLGGNWALAGLSGSLSCDRTRETGALAHGVFRRLSPNGAFDFSADLTGPLSTTATWPRSIGQLSLTAKDFTLHPDGAIAPITVTIGSVRLAGGVVAVRDIAARYASDSITLASARLHIPPLAQGDIQISEINGTVNIHPGGLPYPKPLTTPMATFQPGGQIAVSGSVNANFRPSPPIIDYDMLLSCDQGFVTVHNIDISQIKFDSEIRPTGATLADLSCNTLGGKITLNNAQGIPTAPFNFKADAFLDRVDLAKLDKALFPEDVNPSMSGLANVNTTIWDTGVTQSEGFIDALHATGQFEVADGNLWNIPAMKKIENASDIAKDALTVGRAAAYFRIIDRIIVLQDAAISAPLFGVMGYGTIGFDGNLDIYAIPTLLGDWREGISHMSNFLGDVVGSVQDFFNNTTSHLLYQVHVFGPAANPQIDTTRGTTLTHDQAQVIGNMVQQSNSAKPMDLLSAPAAPAKTGK